MRVQTKWPPERRAELERRWNAGETKHDIRAAMKLTPGQLSGRITRYNLHSRSAPKHWRSDSPAVRTARTMFLNRVTSVGDAVKPGAWQNKLGARVTKGPWKGFPVYAITLEERATCPRSCRQWISCYGNSMQWAQRMRHGEDLEIKIWFELEDLQRRYPGGFVVRAHILGDWYSKGYVMMWEEALRSFPALHVFGYTAWQHDSRIGKAIRALRDRHWDRFAVRTSGAASGPRTLVVESTKDVPAGAIICPVQTGQTRSCSTCALCWSAAAKDRPVAFLRH